MKPINILIVEDKTAAIDRLKRHLQLFGYQNIFYCQTYEEAIQLCRLEKFDLAILDINLGEHNRDGVALAEYINQHFIIPIIYVTGLSDTKTLQKVVNTNYAEYIVKPFSPQQLFASITLVLMKHPAFEVEIEKQQSFYKQNEIWLLHQRHYVKLEFNTICYVESKDGIIHIYTNTKKFPFSASLSSFLRQTKTDFILRISRKHLINIKLIDSFDLRDHQVSVIINGEKKWLAVSPQHRESTYARFNKLKSD